MGEWLGERVDDGWKGEWLVEGWEGKWKGGRVVRRVGGWLEGWVVDGKVGDG